MRYQLFSDIHLEMSKSFPKITPKCDVIILAGDIGKITNKNFKEFISYCSENWKYIIYVFGNHEFYCKRSIETTKRLFREFFDQFNNIHLLDSSFIKIEDTIIYGFIAWTQPHFTVTSTAREYLNDYNCIHTRNGKLRIEDVQLLSDIEFEKYNEFLSIEHDCANIIIVTHFPPLRNGTSDPLYNESILNPYFSWISLPIHPKIKIWCSGHTHWSYDFEKDGIRYIANQIGYPKEGILSSNPEIFI